MKNTKKILNVILAQQSLKNWWETIYDKTSKCLYQINYWNACNRIMVSKYQDMVSMIYFCQRGLNGDISFKMLFLNSKLGTIHKPRGQIFVHFSPTLPLNNTHLHMHLILLVFYRWFKGNNQKLLIYLGIFFYSQNAKTFQNVL